MDKLSLFRNLLILAAADGRVTQAEIMFLALRCSHWGITDEQFDATLEEVQQGQTELELPRTPHARRELLKDMLRLMAIDGELADDERRLFAVASARMGIEQAELDELIDAVVEDS